MISQAPHLAHSLVVVALAAMTSNVILHSLYLDNPKGPMTLGIECQAPINTKVDGVMGKIL